MPTKKINKNFSSYYLFLLLICFFVTGCNFRYGTQQEDIINMYTDYIEEWKTECKKSFEEASKEVYNKKPDENIIGPHEDPKKCICKGTGVIIQGDNHNTPCPFHAKSQGLNIKNKEVTIKEFRK